VEKGSFGRFSDESNIKVKNQGSHSIFKVALLIWQVIIGGFYEKKLSPQRTSFLTGKLIVEYSAYARGIFRQQLILLGAYT